MSGRRLCAALASIFAVGLATAIPATAEFGPIRLVSRGAAQQADFAVNPALSADGRYLAFSGRLGVQEGVFREDLGSGEIIFVGSASISSATSDQTAPSISADGRYVSFTTTAQLDPDDDVTAGSSDVYVADLAGPLPQYELVSALDGCDPDATAPHAPCGLTYFNPGPSTSLPTSSASGRVALSADGRKVVFVTGAESNLTSGPGGSTEGVPTPPFQVVLRDLDSHGSTLVSVERDSATGAMTDKPVPGGAMIGKSPLPLLRGAALSADGTTVAWLGAHLPAQVEMDAQEAAEISVVDTGLRPYDEPLWRRVGDGTAAPTRRVIGGAGSPFPSLTNKNDLNSAQGWLGVEKVVGVPRLSADGETVALIGNPTEATNVFVVDMTDGLDRVRATSQLTREIVVNPADPNGTINVLKTVPLNGHIFDLALSADSQKVAFVTARQRFPLAPPNLIGSPPASVGVVELYAIDRASETLRRITHGLAGPGEPSINFALAGQPAGQPALEGIGATAPSFGVGGLIAFSSSASNLVVGDSNENSDAFVVEDHEAQGNGAPTAIAPAPSSKRPRPRWRLTLAASSLPDGSVKVVAGVPAGGKLRARVGAEPRSEIGARRLGGAKTRAKKSGSVAIELRLPSGLRHLAHTREGVYALTRVSFRRPGRKTLTGKIQVRFHAHPKKKGRNR